MRGVVGLEHGACEGTKAFDCLKRVVHLNQRIVDHIRTKPERAPFLSWVQDALKAPLEVWRNYRIGESGLEPRLYYLFAVKRPSPRSIVVVVGEHDCVAFNVFEFEPRQAKSFRIGQLVHVGYDSPYGRCPHGCCDRTELR